MQETSSRQRLAGVLILLGLIAQILGFTGLVNTAHAVSYLLWLSVALLWRDIPKRSRVQAGVLMGLGLSMLLVARLVYNAEVDWPAMLQGNAFVAAMLVGVSFISLVGKQQGRKKPPVRS